jgi:hypothetical protein
VRRNHRVLVIQRSPAPASAGPLEHAAYCPRLDSCWTRQAYFLPLPPLQLSLADRQQAQSTIMQLCLPLLFHLHGHIANGCFPHHPRRLCQRFCDTALVCLRCLQVPRRFCVTSQSSRPSPVQTFEVHYRLVQRQDASHYR